jgi:LytS/YehU family sensor histidine kinase
MESLHVFVYNLAGISIYSAMGLIRLIFSVCCVSGFYLFVFAFILLIRRIQRVQLQQKFKAEKRMAELQLLSLRNQMDPHFTFNVLNTIGAAILQNKNEESYNLLLKFSKMIRTTVSSSDQICRSLQEELDFVKNYLDLQLIRCNGCFKFTIDVDKHIDPLQPLPKMILQTYVENALKHGLIPKKSGGLLKISAIKENGRISLTIEDNGVGRQQAQINGTLSTGVGLKIMRQYYELLNRNNQFHITEEFPIFMMKRTGGGYPGGDKNSRRL